MSEPRAERYDTTGATSYDAATEAERRDTAHTDTTYTDTTYGDRVAADDAATGDLTTTGVDVDERLDRSVDENLHSDHRLDDLDEHEHELPTMGVDVDAALDRAVDENR